MCIYTCIFLRRSESNIYNILVYILYENNSLFLIPPFFIFTSLVGQEDAVRDIADNPVHSFNKTLPCNSTAWVDLPVMLAE